MRFLASLMRYPADPLQPGYRACGRRNEYAGE
jgi:hypothetical protein